MKPTPRSCSVVATTFTLSACAPGDPTKAEPEDSSLSLGEGVVLQLLEDGGFRLEVDGHPSIETATVPFVAVDFDETIESNLGMWRFTRTTEAMRPYRMAATSVTDC